MSERGLILSDLGGWSTSEWDVAPQNVGDPGQDSLVTGPLALLFISLGVVLLACLAISFSNWAGYLLGVTGSGLSIFTAAVDQRRQASVNYSSLGWFSPSVRTVRWLSTLVTLVHIVYLARSVGAN